MLHFKTYHSLPEDAALIRQKVFMEEQGFVDEFDADRSTGRSYRSL